MAKASISEHEAFEQELGDKNPQLQDYLATTGVIGDETIKDPNKRKKQQKKRKHLYWDDPFVPAEAIVAKVIKFN